LKESNKPEILDKKVVEEEAREAGGIIDLPLEAGMIIPGAGNKYRWPNCTMPYEIDPNLPNQTRITDAMSHWTQKTGFKFVKRTTQADWVYFTDKGGCWSMIGRRGGQQIISLGTGCSTGNAIHEIGHAIGLFHEQSRNDRDTYVRINWANIDPQYQSNFSQYLNSGIDIGKYDYCSIMHYPRQAFSKNGQDTITPLQAGAECMGQRQGLSPFDIAAVKQTYPECVIDRCLIYATAARRQYNLYRTTQKRIYLCRYYWYVARYCDCKYRATGNQVYLNCYRNYTRLYRNCTVVGPVGPVGPVVPVIPGGPGPLLPESTDIEDIEMEGLGGEEICPECPKGLEEMEPEMMEGGLEEMEPEMMEGGLEEMEPEMMEGGLEEMEPEMMEQAPIVPPHFRCFKYRTKALEFLNKYRQTQIKKYLCYSYLYYARYLCCLYRYTRNPAQKKACLRFRRAYLNCIRTLKEPAGADLGATGDIIDEELMEGGLEGLTQTLTPTIPIPPPEPPSLVTVNCVRYRNTALRYLQLYRTSNIKKYLCYFYLYLARYFYCLYKQTQKPIYLQRYNYYYKLYKVCIA
jgi:hypothetical protein